MDESLNKLSYFNLLSKIKGRVAMVTILSIVIYFLGIVITTMFNAYFNIIIPQKLSALIFYVMSLYIGIALIKFVLNFLATIMTNSLNKILDSILSNEFFSALFRKSTGSLEYFGIGEIISTLSNIILIRQRFFTCVVSLPLNFVWLVTSLFLLFRISSYLSILVFILIILLMLIIAYANDRYQLLSRHVLSSNKSFNDDMIDIFSNVSMIKGYQQEVEFIERGKSKLLENLGVRNKLLNFDAKFTGVKQMVLELFNIMLFSLGTLLIIDGRFSIGTLLTYNSMIGFALNPLLNLASVQALLTQGKAAQELLFNFLNSKLLLFGNEKFPLHTNSLILQLDNVSFSFDSRTDLLSKLNLCSNGETNVAITGTNGSGKTTIGKLLARYYLPDSGTIKINGVDISRICEKEFSKHVIFVDSDEELISSTIHDNITLGRDFDSKTLEDMLAELKLHEFVDKLERGYNSQVGKDGLNLSLGQKQLIKIARATLEERSIYIFDEITNGLDVNHKQDVMQYLLKLPGLKFFITHDRELIELCDKCFVIGRNG